MRDSIIAGIVLGLFCAGGIVALFYLIDRIARSIFDDEEDGE